MTRTASHRTFAARLVRLPIPHPAELLFETKHSELREAAEARPSVLYASHRALGREGQVA